MSDHETNLHKMLREAFIEGAVWHMKGGRCTFGDEYNEALRRWPEEEQITTHEWEEEIEDV